MPELTEYQLKWISQVGDNPVSDEDILKSEEIERARESVIGDLIGVRLGNVKQDIAKAQDFVVTLDQDKSFFKAMWAKAHGESTKKTMKWHASSEDVGYFGYDILPDLEIDTTHDLPGSELIPEDTLKRLYASLEKILEVQREMLKKIDEDGNPLFSDEDIRKELWTPLVRDGTIPENMVPDRFSEQALAFEGAAKFYQQKIDEYSEKSTGKEGLIRALGIAKDTASLVSTFVVQSVTIGNAQELSDLGTKSSESTLTDGEKARKLVLETEQQYVALGSTLLNGGFELAYEGVKEHSKGKKASWAGFIDKSLQVLAKVAASAVGPITGSELIKHDGDSNEQGKIKKVSAAISAGIQGSISGIRLAPTMVAASMEPNAKKRRALIQNAINTFADAVGQCFNAIATDYGHNKEKQGHIQIVGAAVTSAIKTLSKADLVIKALDEGKPEVAAIHLGAGAIQGVLGSCAELIVNATLSRDVSQEEFNSSSTLERNGLVVEGEKSELNQDVLVSKLLGSIGDKMNEMATKAEELAEQEMPKIDSSAVEFAKKMQEQLAKENQEKAEKELSETFGKPEVVQQMFQDFDEKMVGYDELYKTAQPDPDILGKPPSDVEKSIQAIEAAIARTAELRARAEAINGITSAGTAIIGSLIPGGGAVIAAQSVAYDIYVLTKSVEVHNKWCDSTKVAYRSSSAYGPAIEKMMNNARIHLSQDSVKLVLDSLKLGSEVGRCFDPTGISTIASASLTMTSALVDYGYKMHKEVEITRGWNAYVRARENPSDRKNARKALRMNSTLAKCCIAYGACIAKDAAAMDAISRCGLSPVGLADDNDVCVKLIDFLENEMNRDPAVLQVEKSPKNWQKGRPELTLVSWLEIKTSAVIVAEPKLSDKSAKTPAMDRLLADLAKLWENNKSYAAWSETHDINVTSVDKERYVNKSKAFLEQIQSQMESYTPLTTSDAPHVDMQDIAKTYHALARMNIVAAEEDLKDYHERKLPNAGESTVVVSQIEMTADKTDKTKVTVTVLDSDKVAVPGKDVIFSITGGGNTIDSSTVTTNDNGVAETEFTTMVAEKKEISAKVGDITINEKATVTAKPGPVDADKSTVKVDREKMVADGSVMSVTFKLLDANDNPLVGKKVTLIVESTGDNTLTQPGETNSLGVSTGSFTTTDAEEKNISAQVDGRLITQKQTVTAQPGPIDPAKSKVEVVGEATMTADGSDSKTVTVTVLDAYNNPLTEEAVTVSVSGRDNVFDTNPKKTDSSGVVKITFTTTKAEEKEISAQAGGETITQKQTVTAEAP